MKHKRSIKSLGRAKNKREAMFKNMTQSLLKWGYVVTTDTKAKELRKYFEPLVTAAKEDLVLSKRRHLISKLRDKAELEELVEIANKHAKRSGGYLRLTKVAKANGNGATMTKVEIIE